MMILLRQMTNHHMKLATQLSAAIIPKRWFTSDSSYSNSSSL